MGIKTGVSFFLITLSYLRLLSEDIFGCDSVQDVCWHSFRTMERFDGVEEKQLHHLLNRIISKSDFWTMEKPFPEKIGFQRFGLQLREEDFEQNGVSYRDFLIRDRNEDSKIASGFSAVRNNEKEFKVELDVWPFIKDELSVWIVSDKYFEIQGARKEKLEDGSECTQNFQRYYPLPRGSNSDTIKCEYNNGTLTITVDKEEGSGVMQKPRDIPIEPVAKQGMLNEDRYTPEMPMEIRKVTVANGDESVAESTDPSKEVPESSDHLKNHDDAYLKKLEDRFLEVLEANDDSRCEAVMTALELFKKARSAFKNSKNDGEAVQTTTEPSEKANTDDENASGDGNTDKIQDDQVLDNEEAPISG